MKQIFETDSEQATRDLGAQLADSLMPGTVIALNGTLGSGKTRLVQGIGMGLEIDAESIVSPTYTLCVPYQGRLPLLHLDAYRIKHSAEVDELGLDEWVEQGAVLVIEWHERHARYLPPPDVSIEIELCSGNHRKITVASYLIDN